MKHSTLTAINVLILCVLLAGTAVSGFFIYQNIRRNIDNAASVLPELGSYASSVLLPSDETDRDVLYNLRLLLVKNSFLKSFIVYGEDGRLLYVYARNPRYVQIPDSSFPARSEIVLSTFNPFQRLIVHEIDTRQGIYTEGVFDVFPYERAFFIARLFFLFLLLLFVLLLISIIITQRTLSHSGTVSGHTVAHVPHDRDVLHPNEHELPHDEKIYTPDSLLCYEEYFAERLDNELRRSASFDQDLVLALLHCDTSQSRERYIRIAEEVREFFTFHDLLFEYNDHVIAVILPNTDIDEGIARLSDFQRVLFKTAEHATADVSIGLSSRNGRLISYDRITEEAMAALRRAQKDRTTKLIGFRPDPGKYRTFIANLQS
ncbi:MAG: hypothetical protein SVR04_08125 [Spirochaetota bacterium]|nr:hypothetical protein [Spirochaetota bacterium]